jgi:hypothetical protein
MKQQSFFSFVKVEQRMPKISIHTFSSFLLNKKEVDGELEDVSPVSVPLWKKRRENENEKGIQQPTVNVSKSQSRLRDYLIDSEWRSLLCDEFEKNYFHHLETFLCGEFERGVEVYPPKEDIFNALNSCPLSQVKVVILGQVFNNLLLLSFYFFV